MFVTSPSFEKVIPVGLAAPGERYWLFALLSGDSPWFLFTYRAERADGPVVNTVLVAWDSALKELLAEMQHSSVVSLYCISPANTFAGEWQMHSVSAVWTSSSNEQSQVGPLLFTFDGLQGLFDPFLAPVPAAAGRQQLLKLASRSRTNQDRQ